MFENKGFRSLYRTSDDRKAFYWGKSTRGKICHYLTIEGNNIAIQVDDNGKNCMVFNEDFYGFEKYFKIDIIGEWNN